MEEKLRRSLYPELDDIDYGIVRALQENARVPFTTIAKELGVTEKTIRMRVQQMQDEGVLSLIGVINPIKAGLTAQAQVLIAVETDKFDDVVAELQKIDEVRVIILTTGEYQLSIKVLTRDYEQLSQFLIKKLNKIKGIARVNVMNELKVLKSRLNFIR